MITKPKVNSVVTHEVREGVLVFKVAGEGDIVLDLTKVHASNRAQAELHGWAQRVVDAAAISRDTATGKSASPHEKYNAMAQVVEHYNSGTAEWRLRARATGSDSLLVQCLVELRPDRSLERIREHVGQLTKAQRDQLLVSDQVRPIADKIRSQVGAGVDAGKLLEGL